jgi:hypothetical protein
VSMLGHQAVGLEFDRGESEAMAVNDPRSYTVPNRLRG